ncbi:hypothetical protein BDF21DRAFT_412239 [Thamnidium elegans]|nr:hypothetical protein BDF21DRAFT_412239 [Thamnidium elegans]
MSSKRNNAFNTGSGNFSKNSPRGPPRERNHRPQQRPNFEPDTGESRATQLLRRIFNDEDDTSFSRRLSNANQLLKILEESRNTISDSLQFRQEQMHLLDICIYDEGLRRIIELGKVPSSLRNALAKIVSGLACYTRLDLALSWIFDRLENWPSAEKSTLEVNRDREWKKWLLCLLKQVLIDSSTDQYTYRQAQEMAPTILSGIITFLDTMDSPEFLPTCIDILIFFSESYQSLFGQRFKDIIDLLVGWNMEIGLPESKRTVLISSYTKFSVYWASSIPFAVDLLNHFLNDMRGIVRGLATMPKDDSEEYMGRWNTCTNVFSCYQAILHTIQPLMIKDSKYHDLRMAEVLFEKMLPEVVALVNDALCTSPSLEWIQISQNVLILLISYKPLIYRSYQNDIYAYLAEKSKSSMYTDPQGYLQMLMHFIELWGTDIDENVVFRLLDHKNSPLFELRSNNRNNTKLNEGILILFRFLARISISDEGRFHMNQKNIDLLLEKQVIIKRFYSKSISKRTLKKSMDFIVQNDGSASFDNKNKNDELVSSATVTIAIEDTLLINYLLLDNALVWPQLRFENALTSLEILCMTWVYKCSDLFDSCFQILKDYWKSLNFFLDDEYEFEMISYLVTDLLENWADLSLHTRKSICEFVKSILTTLHMSESFHLDPTTIFKPIMSGFLYAAGVERNNNSKVDILKLIAYYCQIFGSANIIDLVLENVQRSINNPHRNVQAASKDLLTSLNPFMISEVKKFDDTTAAFIQSIIMATPHTGSFRPVHYEIVMKHLGMAEHLIGSDDQQEPTDSDPANSSEWARRLLHHCDTIDNMKNVNIFGELKEEMDLGGIVDLINNSEPLLCYWAMWESARYCMLSRLRTPFGGPQQTFAAFERMLNSLVNNAELKVAGGQNADYLRHLLLLLDRLEVQISNASDGCATGALPAVPRSSLIFFRTNKKTCHDYFSRIRHNIIAGAKIIGNDHLLIVHVIQILSELESNIPPIADIMPWFKELNGYLRELVEACIREQYTDLIYGMQSWYKKLIRNIYQLSPEFKEKWSFEGLIGPIEIKGESTNITVTWFQVAALFASSHDETAIKSLSTLKPFISSDNFGILDMLDRQVVHFYTCLEDYDALQRTLESDSTVIDDFICDSLRSFNSGNGGFEQERSVAMSNIQTFVKSAPLESCLELARLDRFRNWIASANDNNTDTLSHDITIRLTERILQVLKQGIFTNISSLLELQLLQSDWNSLISSAKDWLAMTSGNIPNFHSLPPETKHWARLSTYFERLFNTNEPGDIKDVTKCLGFIQLHSAKVARRQGNFELAQKLINKAALIPETKYLALYERTKVLFKQSNYTQAMETINEVLVHTSSAPEYEELKSKVYLKVARYLKNSPVSEVPTLLKKLDPKLMIMSPTVLQSSVENSVDFALDKSIENNTEDGRPWFEYATHYYKQGWHILDELLRPDSSMPIIVWASKKIQCALEHSDESIDKKHIEKTILGLLFKYSVSIGDQKLVDCTSFTTSLHQIVPFLDENNESCILKILEELQNMIIHKFYASAQSYFRYLSLDIHNNNAQNSSNISSTSMIITATLRILRMLTKYGEALKSLYTEHIEIVRVDLWKQVIPQLFAQLNHPNDFVRQIIGKLVSRICDEYPREIVYDVIVSSTSSKTNKETKQSLNAIANRMMDRNELLWLSTRRMAEELEKITVLLEEKWQNKIASLQFDAMQQFSKLDQEIERLSKYSDEIQREKEFLEIYDGVMKFVIVSVDKLFLETAEDSITSTPHEQWFQKTYGKQLIYAYNLLKKPTSMKEYRRGWVCFQQLHRQLMTETHKVRILELSHVSPYLFSMKRTLIGIPGRHENDESCFIDTFGTSVIVLPTKTKPKKLDMKATDGKKYSYLFKGLEDLHLDERVMQLLTTTNGLLSENGATALRGMKARTYAVIPLSDHSGMIQWVNDATPFFALFKKWQKRESVAHMLLTNDKPNEALMHSLLQRPTETFTSKVASILKASGLRVTANRKHWPKEVLKQAYLELVKETPGDLLEKELYYSSSSATEWYKKTTSFARSLAVTSMIGYIIGLGDRHLDNMLIDFRSGEMIHIDYNVCFEKGKRLRVPELVPYRLTQNLYGALGITGVDGQFRTAAEETLRVLRKHKEVLVTLLDAFVYDPLVDWESEAVETGYRQMMELQTNLGLVATCITEKQSENEKERSSILGSLASLKHNLHQWQESMLLEAESLNEEEGSDDDDTILDNDGSLTQIENDSPSFMGRLPIYLLREVKSHLSGIVSLISNTRSSTEGISPLLESIIIIETDEDNELRPAQKSAKMALDSLAVLDTEFKKLDKQIADNKNYESEWSYTQLLDFIQLMNKSVQEYYSAIRTLEEFGPDSNKNISATAPTDYNNRPQEEFKPVDSANYEGLEQYNESTPDDRAANQNNGSQKISINKIPTNNHVVKIMKRIRSKLEGVDFGVQHKMPVSEQVTRSIEQATSVDNLCLMYEGWTSWV